MEFKTKYKENTPAWVMFDNKPLELRIREIRIRFYPDSNHIKMITEILYGLGDASNCYEPISLLKKEDEIFTTKKRLLDSL